MAGSSVGPLIGGLIVGAVVGVGGSFAVTQWQGNTNQTQSEESATCSIGGAGSSDSALFTIDGKSFGPGDLPSDVQDIYFQVESQAYRSRKDFLDDVALRIALAMDKSGGAVEMASLPPLNSLLEVPEPSEEELKSFYEKNEKNLPPGSTYEGIKPQLVQFLSGRSLSTAVSSKVTELTGSGRLAFGFTEPTPPVVELPIDEYPQKGGSTASVTLVEVSDYLCPHCRTVQTEVKSVLEEFGEQVRFVQVDFALRPSGLSGYLVRGAYCAKQQSDEAYWAYHAKAFEVPLEKAEVSSDKEVEQFVETAVAAADGTSIEKDKLKGCIEGNDAAEFVSRTNAVFSQKGVSGTPTFFLNNRKVLLAGKGLRQAVAEALQKPASN